MSQIITRATSTDLSIRSDGRTVHGIAVPFNSPTDIRDFEGEYEESFKFGAFTRTIAERGSRVKFLAHHDSRAMPLGRATLLREDPAGLYAEFRVSETQAGDEALELIRDGALDGFSIGFRAIRETWSRSRDVRTITEAALLEVSAVNFPAYDPARIAGVRSKITTLTPEQAAARLRLLQARYQL
ncbi:HK97 family phage prohead protease [Rhodococcus cerastii]|uniref:HK97 family phage prohead protease n=1 Tax=Rhodococcus TaxID=1827 RepID=UPI001BEA12E0|nr:HK97 family phage prohead protease [Rhodococcus qingshengii]MBT2271405.1 HK97 family phage prohead protease [Rhodococcus qingshengii]MCD2156860.1 HK97 family phage prohead protease [Rhodococcus cerastii]